MQKRFLRSQFESTNEKENFPINNLEEMSESMIRKKYDILKQENVYKRQTLERILKETEQISQLDSLKIRHPQTRKRLQTILKETEQISQLTNIHTGDQSSVESTYKTIAESLEIHKAKLEEETANSKTYKQMYDRMMEDKITLELKSNDLHKQLRTVTQILDTERFKCRKSYEAIHSSRNNLKNLNSMVIFDNKQKLDRISSLEKAASSRKEAAERREERIRRIAEIADIAANENTESQEINMKQSLILHKIWHSYLKYKLDKKLKGAIEIEDAYQCIRSATGLQNINEIVNSFIGKEENQAQLRNSIEEANKSLDDLKKRNEKSKSLLKEIMLIENSSSAIEFLREVRSMDESIIIEKKQTEKYKNELSTVNDFLDEIAVWSKNTQKSLNLEEGGDIKKVFQQLKDLIQKDLVTVAERRERLLKEWLDIDNKTTDQLVKSIYQENYSLLSNRFRAISHEDSHHSSFSDDENKKKLPKKIKIS
ncbi:hypothetical protein SteCoe_34468 [Stentor coeruleus]|uniref:Uncharacterized protein n=1 Tax=Stentor coeruleus TaxID=5963 RepID=A0A1R2AUG1_9CILI|nr:hypothetical protein SteCoe_34468 [Stentor coeruleus]